MQGIKKVLLSKTTGMWLLAGLVLGAISFIKVFALFRQGFDLGDGSTFYAFSHFLSQGEAIYTDFIHFRTPGSYFLWSSILLVGNGGLALMKFALNFETSFLYQAILFVSLGVLFKWKRLWLVATVTLLCILLPGYLQIRAALALLAVVLYIRSELSVGHRSWWLLATGVVAGLAFTFGQEAAAVVVAVIGVYELAKLLSKQLKLKETLKNIGRLLAGFFAGISPLVLYVVLFSSISNFLYYTLYYAFILQPKGMNLPFPAFSYDSLVYYIPFTLITICLGVFYVTRSKKTTGEDKAFIIITLLAIMRLVTLLGRTDMGHLIYVLPELILISAWSISRLVNTKIETGLTTRAAFILLACLFSMLLATKLGSPALLLAAGVAVALFTVRDAGRTLVAPNKMGIYAGLILGAVVAFGLYAMLPVYYDQARQVKAGLTGSYKAGKTQYKGVYGDPAEINSISQVESEITRLHPTTLFSFPIQAYFYTLVPHHATKFLTYEPQTTLAEQNETIEDLKKNNPEVVIFDPAQALDMSASLYKISDYVVSHYRIEKVITGKRIVWVMVRDDTLSGQTKKSIFSLYQQNNKQMIVGLQNPEKSVINAIAQSPSMTARFTLYPTDQNVQFSLYNDGAQNVCGTVTIMSQAETLSTEKFCGTGEPHSVQIPLGANSFRLTVDQPLVWNDLTVKGSAND